jgi:hypothetical protein
MELKNINHSDTMDNDKKKATSESERMPPEKDKKSQEEEIDEELDQTFPASDPPSYSSPGNDKDAD